jgi:quercetin dioxygenase-like cupin family protein
MKVYQDGDVAESVFSLQTADKSVCHFRWTYRTADGQNSNFPAGRVTFNPRNRCNRHNCHAVDPVMTIAEGALTVRADTVGRFRLRTGQATGQRDLRRGTSRRLTALESGAGPRYP